MDKKSDESEFDSDTVQLNVDPQSYGEQSITGERDNVTKNCDQEISKELEILEQTKIMMKENSKKSEQQSTTSLNDNLRRVTRQQTKNTQGIATRTRNQS